MYYLISTQLIASAKKNADPTTAQSIFPYSDINEAKSAFYSTMASNYANPDVLVGSCVLTNELGYTLLRDYKDIREPETVE